MQQINTNNLGGRLWQNILGCGEDICGRMAPILPAESGPKRHLQPSESTDEIGNPWYTNPYLISLCLAFLLISTTTLISSEMTKRRYKKLVLEAEVKLQLALFKLERRH